jgi:hypothetical protein
MTTKEDQKPGQTPAPKRRQRKNHKLERDPYPITIPPCAPSLPNEQLPDPIHIDDDTIISF